LCLSTLSYELFELPSYVKLLFHVTVAGAANYGTLADIVIYEPHGCGGRVDCRERERRGHNYYCDSLL